jgi:hypothetical protein
MAAPKPPTDFQVDAIGPTTILLGWVAPGDETGYEIQRREPINQDWEAPINIDASQQSYEDAVKDGTIYEYRIRATNADGASEWVYSDATSTPLAPPGSLSATVQPGSSVLLAWEDNSQAETGYEVWRSDSGRTFNRIATLPRDTTSYTDQLQSPGSYAYTVRAYQENPDATKYSECSNEALVVIETTTTTTTATPSTPTTTTTTTTATPSTTTTATP